MRHKWERPSRTAPLAAQLHAREPGLVLRVEVDPPADQALAHEQIHRTTMHRVAEIIGTLLQDWGERCWQLGRRDPADVLRSAVPDLSARLVIDPDIAKVFLARWCVDHGPYAGELGTVLPDGATLAPREPAPALPVVPEIAATTSHPSGPACVHLVSQQVRSLSRTRRPLRRKCRRRTSETVPCSLYQLDAVGLRAAVLPSQLERVLVEHGSRLTVGTAGER